MADNPLQQGQTQVLLPVYDPVQVRTGSQDLNAEQRLINCWAEVYRQNVTGEASYAVNMRPGLDKQYNMTGGTGPISAYGTSSGMVCLANMVVTQLYDVYVAAFFNTATSRIFIVQYRPIALTCTLIGTIGNATPADSNVLTLQSTFNANIDDKVFITETTQGDTLLPAINVSYQKSDQSAGFGYHASSSAGVFTANTLRWIDSSSFPSGLGTPKIITGPFQFMNGNNYIMTLDGFIYNSSLTATGNPDYTVWNTLSTVTASQYPDRGVGVYRYKHLLLAVGQDSIEFWSADNSNPPASPLVHTDQAFIKFGAVAPKLCMNIDDVFYWVAYGSGGTVGVWKLDNYQPTKISDARIDMGIQYTMSQGGASGTGLTISSYYTMETVTMLGKRQLLLNGFDVFSPLTSLMTSDVSILCFNITDGTWWEMSLPAKNGTTTSVAGLMPANSFPPVTTAGWYTQYCFRRPFTAANGDDVASTLPFSFDPIGQSFVDLFTATGSTGSVSVIMQYQSNTHWFGNVMKKRVNKIRPLADIHINAGLSFSEIFYNRDNYGQSTTQFVRTDIGGNKGTDGNAMTQYVNNCGMGRSWSFGFSISGGIGSGGRVIGIEVFLSQIMK